jgi:ATP-dependent DNA ligase
MVKIRNRDPDRLRAGTELTSGHFVARAAVIDGEAVAIDAEGRADFHALRSREGQAGAILVAYDVLVVSEFEFAGL